MSAEPVKPKRQPRQFGGVRNSATKTPHPLWQQVLIGLGLVCLVGVIVTAVWYGTRIQSLQISDVQVIGAKTVPEADVLERVAVILNDSYFKLIPRRFTYLYPEQQITEVVGRIERIKQVQVEKIDRQTLAVVFEEHEPFALWCETVDTADCMFVDRNGYGFTAAPNLAGNAFVRFVGAEAPKRESIVWIAPRLAELTDFIDTVEANQDIYVTHVVEGEEADITLLLARGGELKIDTATPFSDTYENLVTILTSEQFIHLEPGNFKYIDLRFGNKVFVNEEWESEVASSTATTTADS